MIDDKNQNGWNEYSRLVLNELQRLNDSYQLLREDLNELRTELAKKDITNLSKWKESVDEVFSPSQMKELKNDVENLKSFKTTAVTIFAVIQFIMATIIALSKYFFK